jgi:DNA-binding CsgD family transcriptional regulator
VAALEPLREAAARYRTLGWCEPSLAGFHGDLLDALVAAGEREEAEEELARLAADAERSTVSWTRAVVARSRGLLAEDDGFAAHFAGALELHEVAPQPFERARTELLFAERLRRAGDRPAARDQLRSAVEAFEALGARPWAERARRELAFGSGSSGVQTATEPPPATVELTPQELRVALLVAQGLTNREAGAALFLSPKTIEHILTATYKKLGRPHADPARQAHRREDSGVVARA